MSDMADARAGVVDRIARFLATSYPCDCGADDGSCSEEPEADTIVELMESAGFGPVREAQEAAWQEGWAHYRKYFSPNFPEFGINPYGAVTVRGGE